MLDDITILAGVALLLCSVLLLFGCVCHLFRKAPPFAVFENNYDAESGQEYSMSPTHDSAPESPSSSQVTFEPLPDILAKTVSATALRPRITSVDKEWQKGLAKQVTVFKPFQRSYLMYIKELGLGWFGQVLYGDAEKIIPGCKKSKVVIKLLKDDANATERQLFLEEMVVYRELEHQNVLSLLGQCTETYPFLVILEHAACGDLKSYLRRHSKEAEDLIRRGILVDFMFDMSAGLMCLHNHGYLHHDFSCRNCLVMADLSVKVGDYGIGEDHYREDYYDTGQDLLPVRWMAPESLQLNNSIWQVCEFSKEANIWSFGVAMWEITEMGKLPYGELKDEEVLHQVVQGTTKPRLTPSSGRQKQRLNDVMRHCWLEADQRPTVEQINGLLEEIVEEKEKDLQEEFDAKWDNASPQNTPSAQQPSQQNAELPTSGTSKQDAGANTQTLSQTPNNSNLNFTRNEPSEIVVDSVNTSPHIQTPSLCIDIERLKKPVKDNGMTEYQLTSTPISRDVSSEYVSVKSEENTSSKFFTADTSLNQSVIKADSSLQTPTKTTVDVKETLVTLENDAENLSNASSVEFAEIDVEQEDDHESRSEAEKLQMLKDSIADALGRSSSKGTDSPKIVITHAAGDSSPSDEYDIAREIYISKGTSIPPSEHSSNRVLGTIPEDAVPCDPVPVQSTNVLKFEESMEMVVEDSNQVTFEWDDYIGDELVGKVMYPDNSPRQTMDFKDWTLEQDSSSQESESQNHSKGGDTAEQKAGSASSSNMSTPYASSDNEVKSNKSGSSSSYVHDILTNRISATHHTNKSAVLNKHSFYALSHSIDIDSSEHASSDSESSTSGMPMGAQSASYFSEEWEMD